MDGEFAAIYDAIEDLGHQHVTDFINTVEPKDFYTATQREKVKHYKETVKAVKKADTIILETSLHSLAIGHLANLALDFGKPVVALHLKAKEPYFLSGVENDKLIIEEYNLTNIKKVLKSALDYATEQMDTRFNFFISPRIGNYLDWIAKHKKTPRAVFLRKLIEQDMEKNKDYSS